MTTAIERQDALEHLLHVKTLMGARDRWEVECIPEYRDAAWAVVLANRSLYKFLNFRDLDEEDAKAEMDVKMFHFCWSWDPSLGAWSTYAVASLRYHLSTYRAKVYADTYSPVSLPVHLRSKQAIQRALEALAKDEDASAGKRMAFERDNTRPEVRSGNLEKALNALESKRVDFFHLMAGEAGEAYEWGQMDASLVSMDESDLCDAVFDAQMRRAIQDGMRTLDERSQRIIAMRFGFNAENHAMTLNEVGSEIGVTRERIRQIEIKAVQKLRNMPALRALIWVD